MKVKEIMTSQVQMIDSDESVQQAASKMKSLDIGALPVCHGDELLGIITDRDIAIRTIAQGRDPSSTAVSDIMTPEVFCCYEDDDISEAASMMEEKSVRRLLVLDNDENICGFLSLSDFSVRGHNEHLTYEVLEQVSTPSSQQW